jgi:haloalkane dehalogenase
MTYREAWIDRNGHRMYARDYPGQESPIILMHGFPDNLHLYDRLVGHLSSVRRVITFDFLGWGDKPARYPYTATDQTGDLDAVITQLGLDEVTLVAHEASGPPAIDWALEHPDRVSALILLNTYYCLMPTLRPPEAIALYSTPLVRNLGRGLAVFRTGSTRASTPGRSGGSSPTRRPGRSRCHACTTRSGRRARHSGP